MRAFLFCIISLWSFQLVAQQPEKSVNAPTDTGSYRTQDTSSIQPVVVTNKPVSSRTDSIGPRKHSPKTATLLSLCLPGAGQIYNRKNWWWKVPIIYGGGAALVYGAVFYNSNYNDFKNAYEFKVLNNNAPTGNPRFDRYSDNATLLAFRNSYREARDQCLIGLGVLYALQIVDAAVEAHFFDFNVSEDLSLNVQPQFVLNGPMSYSGVQLTLKLK